jgi:hypothetical protein
MIFKVMIACGFIFTILSLFISYVGHDKSPEERLCDMDIVMAKNIRYWSGWAVLSCGLFIIIFITLK